ncbi:GPI2-domain-containing protein [Ceraceosorus guamensis]|uniref:GPI2-domain-containing protein n=1 Tax=Ceraceosorus guamensis TaxID=1522189 RepID=A0A316VZP4_9BASI|nr:GPI2-domain-containing protein [Ceraceosorus guamensis]PWN40985.1 GPI2-domain-containing protein [Ceraceosorus guamensis]
MSNIANASITQTASRNDVGSVEVDQWEKVLWKTQPFPDSYVPSSFLSGLRRQTPQHIKLRSLVVDALPITQQLATILIFVGLYAHLLLGNIGPLLLSGTALFVMLASPAQNRLMRRPPHSASHSPSNPDAEPSPTLHAQVTSPPASIKGSGARGVARVVLALLLLSLSPILRSLSESTSSDSIWALSATLFFGHFALAPYASGSAHGILDASSHSSQVAPVRYAVSVNAAIAASVVLSSRLVRPSSVFSLLLLSCVLFSPSTNTPFPAADQVAQRSRVSRAVCLCAASIAILAPLSYTAGIACALVLGGVAILAPMALGIAHRSGWRKPLHGPWDPAIPIIRTRAIQ